MLRSLTVRVVSTTPNLIEIYSIKIDCATPFPDCSFCCGAPFSAPRPYAEGVSP
jgi:hypothetical protein